MEAIYSSETLCSLLTTGCYNSEQLYFIITICLCEKLLGPEVPYTHELITANEEYGRETGNKPIMTSAVRITTLREGIRLFFVLPLVAGTKRM
jgi:hypothetical protein